MINIAGIIYDDTANGIGFRITIFISGCKHRCKGCQNRQAWKFDYGKEFTKDIEDTIINYIKEHDYIDGITLSGGDPMYSASELCKFVDRYKRETGKSIWIYTGFKYEDILSDNDDKLKLLKKCDIVVDGRFKLEDRDTTIAFRGSPNQRIIDIKKSMSKRTVIDVTSKF